MKRAQLTAVVVGALIASTLLTGCVNRPGDASAWLSAQPGIVGTSVLSSGQFDATGAVRAELADDVGEERLDSLVKAVRNYLSSHGEVAIQLGRDGDDFAISTDDDENAAARTLWESVSEIPGIVNSVSYPGYVDVRTHREDAVAILDAVHDLDADTAVYGYPDDATATPDLTDDFFDAGIYNLGSVLMTWPADCTPTAPERDLGESFFSRPEIAGGDLEFCSHFDPYYAEDASLAAFVPPLYDELVAGDLLEFPVTIHQVVGPAPDGHLLAVTPGVPAALAILPAFEAEGVPSLYFELDTERNLQVWQYETAPDVLAGVLLGQPAASLLPSIRVEGSTFAVTGTISDLPVLLEQAGALAGASEIFTNVDLGTTSGFMNLTSPVGADPDVDVAAQALLDSGAWQGRAFRVAYVTTSATITDGVAVIDNPDYTDPRVILEFIAAWEKVAG